jgi:signal transduction histidine kinase
MSVPLHEFLAANRAELIERCRVKVAQRRAPKATDSELEHGIPQFLEQLIQTLLLDQTEDPVRIRKVSGRAGGGKPVLSEIGAAAARHGHELFQHGFTIDQVVHDYGDLCQAVSDLAAERNARFEVDEFRTLNRCLDNAIAEAVTEFGYRRDIVIADQEGRTLGERLGLLAHELRDVVHTATLAATAIKTGNIGWGGATGAMLDRSLLRLRTLIDRSFSEVRVTAGMPARRQQLSLAEFIGDVKISASLEAHSRGRRLLVSNVDPEIAVFADRDLLFSAVGTLLNNAFKFTKPGDEVSLTAFASARRVLIDIEDMCGGLPQGASENMFRPFTQFGADKSGLGLGLSICRRAVEANGGVLSVHDLPGTGCIFTIDLPRHAVEAVPN